MLYLTLCNVIDEKNLNEKRIALINSNSKNKSQRNTKKMKMKKKLAKFLMDWNKYDVYNYSTQNAYKYSYIKMKIG